MAAIKYIKRTVALDGSNITEQLPTSFFNSESSAHTFIIAGERDGAAVAFTGSVSATFLNANDAVVPLTGSIVDGAAVVTLSNACYALSGRFTLTIDVNGATVYECNSRIKRRSSGTAYDPDDELSVATLNAEIAEMRTATAAANAAATTATDAANSIHDAIDQIIEDTTGIGVIQFSDPALKQYIITNGSTVQWDTPAVSAYSNIKWAVVECSPGDVFTINGRGGNSDRLWAFADASKNIISVSGVSASATELVLTAPANAAYLIINDETDSQSYIGDTTASKDTATILNNTNRSISGNLYETTIVGWEDGYVDSHGAEQPELTLIQRSGYIPVIGHGYLYVHFVHDGVDQEIKGCFYDSAKTFIQGGAIQRGNENHKIPENAAYVRLNRNKFIDGRKEDASYAFFNNGSQADNSKWNGKTINALGDSITYGHLLTNREAERWTALLAGKTGATVNNYGLSGSKVAEHSGDAVQSFVDRVGNLSSAADLNIIFGGTNDYWHQITTIGNYDSDHTYEFCGALNYIFDYLQTNNPSAKMLYIFPTHQYYVLSGTVRTDADDFGHGTFNDFRKAAIDVCAYRGVPMLDLYANSGTCFSKNTAQRNAFTFDGMHPNAAGHKLIADLIADYIEYNV